MIDGSVGGNSARWLNHSCRPNCEAIEDERGRVLIETIRAVKPGDELSIAYGLTID
ncbi:SET domain-containing protein-lysine N-methyltransferase [Paraburkholderia sp. RL17-347-BIC-D]|uniref:SET domain-containing protein-lysine N-methyltransferase n=1 Tax=Paraburkholderia sp. RL17-347-BIC-D TaxID=3031632 RepID=UPI0038B93100